VGIITSPAASSQAGSTSKLSVAGTFAGTYTCADVAVRADDSAITSAAAKARKS